MSSQLTDKELAELLPSEMLPHRTPVPTQMVSSDEFYPDPQNARQRDVEARLLAMADDLGEEARARPPQVLPDGGRHGRLVRGDE